MLKINCDFCGKEDEVRILPSFVVMANSLDNAAEQIAATLKDQQKAPNQKHELIVPEGWVTAPKAIPCDNGPARAWVACSKEHGIMLENQKRAANEWTDEEGNIPTEHVCGTLGEPVNEGDYEFLPPKSDIQ